MIGFYILIIVSYILVYLILGCIFYIILTLPKINNLLKTTELYISYWDQDSKEIYDTFIFFLLLWPFILVLGFGHFICKTTFSCLFKLTKLIINKITGSKEKEE